MLLPRPSVRPSRRASDFLGKGRKGSITSCLCRSSHMYSYWISRPTADRTFEDPRSADALHRPPSSADVRAASARHRISLTATYQV